MYDRNLLAVWDMDYDDSGSFGYLAVASVGVQYGYRFHLGGGHASQELSGPCQ